VTTGTPGPAVAPDPPPETTSAPAPAPVLEVTSPAAVDPGGGSAGGGANDAGGAVQPQDLGAPANVSANVAADTPTP
ncbi:MAG: hypothetical protein M3171_09640, partial [Actinomycetota bacterium]|nr:hypothetical protein [Actinomycetota bacterium]